jgi:hypothetical protein
LKFGTWTYDGNKVRIHSQLTTVPPTPPWKNQHFFLNLSFSPEIIHSLRHIFCKIFFLSLWK